MVAGWWQEGCGELVVTPNRIPSLGAKQGSTSVKYRTLVPTTVERTDDVKVLSKSHLILQQLPITVNDAADTAFRHKKLKYDMPMPSPLENTSTTRVHLLEWTNSNLWVVRALSLASCAHVRCQRSAPAFGGSVGKLGRPKWSVSWRVR